MNRDYTFIFQQYGPFNYEKELAKKEISSLLKIQNIEELNEGYIIKSREEFDSNQLLRLTFFKKVISSQDEELIPDQVFFENSAKKISNESKLIEDIKREDIVDLNGRKESKYSLHGFHDYKGKFYPQLAKSLINIYLPNKSGIVLDPFCGSGTSLFEANALGFDAIGIDLHPLAIKIAYVKTKSHTWNNAKLKKFIAGVIESLKGYNPKIDYSKEYKGDMDYLKSWFSAKILNKLFFCTIKFCKLIPLLIIRF